jgi:IS30 family transposase
MSREISLIWEIPVTMQVMGNHHTKLTAQERDMIAVWIGGGIKLREIARRLGQGFDNILG